MIQQPTLNQRIRLTQFASPIFHHSNYLNLSRGSLGTIKHVYDPRTLIVHWDDSDCEMLIVYDAGDRWEMIL